MYCFPLKMTTACSPKCAFLWGATQFLDIILPGDCVHEEMAVRLTFFRFVNDTELFKCVLRGPRFRWRQSIQYPVQRTASETQLAPRGTQRPHGLFPDGHEFCGVVLWSCWVYTFWALQEKPRPNNLLVWCQRLSHGSMHRLKYRLPLYSPTEFHL